MARNLRMDPVDCIVHCFAAMAKSNTVILALKMSAEDRVNMDRTIRHARKSFQRIYECAALANSSSFKRGERPSSQRSLTPAIPSRQDSVDFDDELDEIDDISNRRLSKYNQLAESFTVSGKTSKKVVDFRKYLSRPNVHMGLHYTDVAAEYATPSNCLTFLGENKHREYKDKITKTNKRDPLKTLLVKEQFQQTVRFAVIGAFSFIEPNLIIRLYKIITKCPILLDRILPFSEQEDVEENTFNTISDPAHIKPHAIGILDKKFVAHVRQWPTWTGPRMSDAHFSSMLRSAYSKDYREDHVTLPKTKLLWCHKMSFTDRISEHRITFKTGDFILCRGRLARMDGVFLHELSPHRRRLFVRVTLVEGSQEATMDNVLNTPLRNLDEAEDIVGLPGIGAAKQYVIHVLSRRKDKEGIRGTELSRGGGKLLLHYNYDIQFM
ncbi:MAG: hypothetical protein Q9174_006271 [Haloplaca sp. 1 TL-2023]